MQKSNQVQSRSLGNEKRLLTTRKLAFSALLVALSVAINSARIGSISFGGFSIIFSGLVLGPGIGFIAVAVGQLITSVIMVPFFITILYTKTVFASPEFWTAFFVRVVKPLANQAINVPIYTLIFTIIIIPISKAVDLKKS